MGRPETLAFSQMGIKHICYKTGGLRGLADVFVTNATQAVQFKVDANTDDVEPYDPAVLDTSKTFVANRPFCYMVWNAKTQVPLLFGQQQCYFEEKND
jgi:hypothetical protein